MPAPTREEVRRGIAYMAASVFMFSMVNALVKWQVATYPVNEVVFFRCLFSLIPCLVLVAMGGGLRVLRTNRLREHVGRAIVQFAGMTCIFTAFGMMPLADAVAITFSSPLFLTVLSIPLLGEKVGPYRWGAVLVGFVGVLVMVHPGSGTVGLGALLALANAFLSASVTIAMRRMSLTEPSATLVTYQVVVTTILAALLLPTGWVAPRWADLPALATIGLCSGVGQYWWTQAFRFAPAAICAPFSYSQMIWALGLGFLVWGDVPGPALVLGAVIVAASGLFILYRETIRRTPATALAARDG
jgi:drug/metabolite transporter (DMT)-like permease